MSICFRAPPLHATVAFPVSLPTNFIASRSFVSSCFGYADGASQSVSYRMANSVEILVIEIASQLRNGVGPCLRS